MQFVADLEPTERALQIMYGIDGRRDLTESTREELTGYAGARPVRIGNGAFDQRQNDVFGAVLDSILLHTKKSERLPRRLWPIVESSGGLRDGGLARAGPGIWEARGGPQHYVSSKLMCWVALDRAAQLAEMRGDAGPEGEVGAVAEEIREDILTHGVDKRGVLCQHYDTDALDASTLLAALFGFLPTTTSGSGECARDRRRADRGRLRPALPDRRDRRRAVRERGHVPDLLVLACLGPRDRRRAATGPDLMERLLRISSPLGLYAEEFDAGPAATSATSPRRSRISRYGSGSANHRARDAGAVLRRLTLWTLTT